MRRQSSLTLIHKQHSYENSKGEYRTARYQTCEVLIVDDVALGDNNVEHVDKNERIRTLFQECTDYPVNGVRLPPGSSTVEWNRFWDGRLEGKRQGDLIIVYFNGKAGGNGAEYRWQVGPYLRSLVHQLMLQQGP